MKAVAFIPLALILICSISQIAAHNHLIFPVPRNRGAFFSKDQNCENNKQDIPKENHFTRGQALHALWSFNNHRGGFVRFSIVPEGQEDTKGIFNKHSHIVSFGCHTQHCGGKGVKFDSGDKFPCNSSLHIPTHLKDGNYVLQWVVYSMYDSDANPNKGLPNYISCANIKIEGGPQETRTPSNCSFSWHGGDKEYSRFAGGQGNNPQDTCTYFMRTNLGISQETVVVDKSKVLGGGRPDEVEWCLKNGGLAKKTGTANPSTGGNTNANANTNTNTNANNPAPSSF